MKANYQIQLFCYTSNIYPYFHLAATCYYVSLTGKSLSLATGHQNVFVRWTTHRLLRSV